MKEKWVKKMMQIGEQIMKKRNEKWKSQPVLLRVNDEYEQMHVNMYERSTELH